MDALEPTTCPSCTWRMEIELVDGICPQCKTNWRVLHLQDELATLREKAEEKVKSVTALMNEWRYIAIEKPMPTDRAIGLEACAEELEAALKGDA